MAIVIKGVIKVQGVPEDACYTNFSELLSSLGQYLGVEIPSSALSNVQQSVEQPSDPDVTWIRRGNGGEILGIYVFSAGKWVALTPAPNQVFNFYGSIKAPPNGYKALTDSDHPGFTANEFAKLKATYIPSDSDPTDFMYYAAIFIGV